MGVVVVVVAAAECGNGGDEHPHAVVVLVVVVKFYLVRIWYQYPVKGFCAETHRLTVKTIYQD